MLTFDQALIEIAEQKNLHRQTTDSSSFELTHTSTQTYFGENTMAFVNEYVPPIEQETSEFLKKARETLRTGASKFDRWTVDRDNDMVLFRSGGGHDIDSYNRDYWSFIDRKGNYYLITAKLSETEISPEEIAVTRSFSYTCDVHDDIPDGESIARIKDALREYGKWHLFNPEAFQHSQLTLIDASTGKEI